MRFCSQKWSSNCSAKMYWWRSVVDKTTRLQYDTACIGYTQHRYPCCHLTIQRNHSIQNHSTCCLPQKPFFVIYSVHKAMSQDEIAQQTFVPVSWPFHDKNWAVFSTKIITKYITKFLFVRTWAFTINLLSKQIWR